jgi:hypothetical protein
VAGDTCEGGVCVRGVSYGGGGSGGGVDPASFTPVSWSTVVGQAGATYHVDAIGADPTQGDVVVGGALDGAYAFAASFAGTTGAALWNVQFPTFSHGSFSTTVFPNGDVLFAATAHDPTTIGTLAVTPALAGSLVYGRLDGSGQPIWLKEVNSVNASSTLVPVNISALGNDFVVVGTGAGDFSEGDPLSTCSTTVGAAFAAAFSELDGSCQWSRGIEANSIAGAVPRDAGDVAVAGVCPFFDPSLGTTCTSGLWVTALSGATGATEWAVTGSGSVSAVRDIGATPDGTVTVLGDATGKVNFGGPAVDFGSYTGSFAARFGPSGAPGAVVRPVEAPYAPQFDAASFLKCAGDRNGKLWIAGRYQGQPTLGGIRFPACRPPSCESASYLARLEPSGQVTSFLPLLVTPLPDGSAYEDDLVLFATTGTLAHAFSFTGTISDGVPRSTSAGAADLGVLRIVP